MAKKRLDLLVLERGLTESRERAKALIMAGEIYVQSCFNVYLHMDLLRTLNEFHI